MRPTKRAMVQALCRNIKLRKALAEITKELIPLVSQGEARDYRLQAEVLEAQALAMVFTLRALFGRDVIKKILKEAENQLPHP